MTGTPTRPPIQSRLRLRTLLGPALPPLLAFGLTVAAAAQDASYRLGPGDRVNVSVFGQAELTGEYTSAAAATCSCRWSARSRSGA